MNGLHYVYESTIESLVSFRKHRKNVIKDLKLFFMLECFHYELEERSKQKPDEVL
jgi:hypothetical protein